MDGIETIVLNEPSQAERTTTTNISLIHGNDNDYRHLTHSQTMIISVVDACSGIEDTRDVEGEGSETIFLDQSIS